MFELYITFGLSTYITKERKRGKKGKKGKKGRRRIGRRGIGEAKGKEEGVGGVQYMDQLRRHV